MTINPYQNLAQGILLQAVEDAKKGALHVKLDALTWLISPDASNLMDYLDVNPVPVRSWAADALLESVLRLAGRPAIGLDEAIHSK